MTDRSLTEQERSAIRDWIGGRDIVDLVHGLRCDAAELQAKLADRNLWEPGYNELAERNTELEKDCEDYRSGCKAAQERVQALEAKETTRNAARLAELASGTVNRVEYDRMVEQRDTMRQERKDARDQCRDLRGALGDIQHDLKAFLLHAEQTWRVEEALFTLECAIGDEPVVGAQLPTPMPDPAIMGLITEGLQQVMTTLANIERPGELARIYDVLDAVDDHLEFLVEDWQAQRPAERD